ncbi:MAG: TrkA C-terminal domain-containing protein, partial [Halobacteria archaeon]|nr:TrkA C-terminal domain-containing protein [Halobacteria archaeon]
RFGVARRLRGGDDVITAVVAEVFVDTVRVSLPFVTKVLGLTVLSAVVVGILTALHRWYARDRVPLRLAVLTSLTVVAVSLSTEKTLAEFLGGGANFLTSTTVLVNLVSFAAAGAVSLPVVRLVDRLTVSASENPAAAFEAELGRIVRSTGRFTVVELPEHDEIDDIEGYDPVDPEIKAALSETEHVFPRGLTVAELKERLVERLRKDYGVGHVDVEVTQAGEVEYVALGSRVAGLGPTLAPTDVAVALRADPSYGTGTGDRVQIWRGSDASGSELERVATGEVRGVTGADFVTLALDADDAQRLDGSEYSLVTLSDRENPERDFVNVLRSEDETMGVVEVESGSPLDGASIADLGVLVVGVSSRDILGDDAGFDGSDSVDVLPEPDRLVEAGEYLYVVGTPDSLRRVEERARVTPGS